METTQACPLCTHDSQPLDPTAKRRYFQCPNCGGIFLAREQLLSAEAELREYHTHNNNIDDPRYQKFVSPLVEVIDSRQHNGQTGLDFGAGPGPVVAHMLGLRGYAIDLYDPFFHPDETVFSKRYDFIFCCEVIEHFNNPGITFSTLGNLLSPSGSLYCRTTLYRSDIDFSTWFYTKEDTHVFFYQRETIAWIASHLLQCDFTILNDNIFYFQSEYRKRTVRH